MLRLLARFERWRARRENERYNRRLGQLHEAAQRATREQAAAAATATPQATPEATPRSPQAQKPLNAERSEIRVFRFSQASKRAVQVGDQSDRHIYQLELNMDTLSLDPEFHTPFCALSYMWGSSAVKRPVRINGIDAEITENLYLALLDLCRSPMGNIPYWWVDALCIDQENAEERRIQVQMMTRIYSSASETVAHFGALNPSAGLRMLGTLAVRRTMPNPAVWMIEAASDEALAADWQALHALLHAPYWSRVWILQETIVSTRLLLFDPAGPWLDIWRALQAFVFIMVMQPIISVPLMENAKVNFGHEFMAVHRQLGLKRKYYPDEGAGTVAAMKATATPPPFLIALCSALQLKATDPRDHLYALLGLTQGGKKLIGAPDYAASPGTVFATFLRSYCHEFQDLDMMLLSSPTRRLPGLPSWVPDLSSFEGHYYRNSIVLETLRTIGNNLDNVVKDKAYLEKGRFHASRFLPTDAEFSDDLRVLTISGINLGRIAGLGGYVGMTITEEGHGNLQDPTPCTQRTEGATASPPSTDRAWILEAVASALTPGILQPPLPAEDDALRKQLPFGLRGEILAAVVHLAVDKKLTSPFLWGLENWWTQNKDLVVRGRTLADWVLGDDLTSEARQTELTKAKHELNETVWRGVAMEGMLNIFLSRLSHVTLEMQRRLLVTVDGQVGLAPVRCGLDDEVWILRGCRIPVILRRLLVGEFEVVSESFIYEYMQGEAIDQGRVFESCKLV